MSDMRFLPKNDDNYIGGSDEVHQPVLGLYDDDNAEPPQADAEREVGAGGVGV